MLFRIKNISKKFVGWRVLMSVKCSNELHRSPQVHNSTHLHTGASSNQVDASPTNQLQPLHKEVKTRTATLARLCPRWTLSLLVATRCGWTGLKWTAWKAWLQPRSRFSTCAIRVFLSDVNILTIEIYWTALLQCEYYPQACFPSSTPLANRGRERDHHCMRWAGCLAAKQRKIILALCLHLPVRGERTNHIQAHHGEASPRALQFVGRELWPVKDDQNVFNYLSVHLFIIPAAVKSGGACVKAKAEDVGPVLGNQSHRLALPSNSLVEGPEKHSPVVTARGQLATFAWKLNCVDAPIVGQQVFPKSYRILNMVSAKKSHLCKVLSVSSFSLRSLLSFLFPFSLAAKYLNRL